MGISCLKYIIQKCDLTIIIFLKNSDFFLTLQVTIVEELSLLFKYDCCKQIFFQALPFTMIDSISTAFVQTLQFFMVVIKIHRLNSDFFPTQ